MLDTAPHTSTDRSREISANALAAAAHALYSCKAQIDLMSTDDVAALKRSLSNVHGAATWMLEAIHAKCGSDAAVPYMGIDGTIYPTAGDHYLKSISSAA